MCSQKILAAVGNWVLQLWLQPPLIIWLLFILLLLGELIRITWSHDTTQGWNISSSLLNWENHFLNDLVLCTDVQDLPCLSLFFCTSYRKTQWQSHSYVDLRHKGALFNHIPQFCFLWLRSVIPVCADKVQGVNVYVSVRLPLYFSQAITLTSTPPEITPPTSALCSGERRTLWCQTGTLSLKQAVRHGGKLKAHQEASMHSPVLG